MNIRLSPPIFQLFVKSLNNKKQDNPFPLQKGYPFRYKSSFTLIEILLSFALMATCLGLFGLSFASYLRKREFTNDVRQVQSYIEDAARLAHSTQHEVDILIKAIPYEDQKERVSISLLLWGAPSGEVKKRLESETIMKSIKGFIVEGNRSKNAIREGNEFFIRFFPRTVDENLIDTEITLQGVLNDLEHTISLQSTWEKIWGPSLISNEQSIPSSIEQEAIEE